MLKRLRRNKRGAVLVEFVIAIVPVMAVFFSFVQLSRIATARLVFKHATIVSARAAAVYSNQHDNNPGADGDGSDQATKAAQAGLAQWSRSMSSVKAEVTDASSKEDPYGWVTVKVTGKYKCTIPMGNYMVCGTGRSKTFEETYKMPHQGAKYKMDQ